MSSNATATKATTTVTANSQKDLLSMMVELNRLLKNPLLKKSNGSTIDIKLNDTQSTHTNSNHHYNNDKIELVIQRNEIKMKKIQPSSSSSDLFPDFNYSNDYKDKKSPTTSFFQNQTDLFNKYFYGVGDEEAKTDLIMSNNMIGQEQGYTVFNGSDMFALEPRKINLSTPITYIILLLILYICILGILLMSAIYSHRKRVGYSYGEYYTDEDDNEEEEYRNESETAAEEEENIKWSESSSPSQSLEFFSNGYDFDDENEYYNNKGEKRMLNSKKSGSFFRKKKPSKHLGSSYFSTYFDLQNKMRMFAKHRLQRKKKQQRRRELIFNSLLLQQQQEQQQPQNVNSPPLCLGHSLMTELNEKQEMERRTDEPEQLRCKNKIVPSKKKSKTKSNKNCEYVKLSLINEKNDTINI